MYCTSRIVVFDLDETLGYYSEFGMFWDALNDFIKKENVNISIDQQLFDKLLDLFPEFSRPNIINILNYLKQKKKENHCHKLLIYTNNQGPDEWAKQIISYFESKLNYKLFDQIIKAYKINGKQIELYRTSDMKKHSDLISCSKIPETTEICFLDDVYHPGMVNDKIYYINIKPYINDIPFDTMISRFLNSKIIAFENENLLRTHLLNFLKKFKYTYKKKTKESYSIDVILSKKILQHLHIFFNKKSSTRKQLIIKNTKKCITKKNKVS
jgi:hypothetical protein